MWNDPPSTRRDRLRPGDRVKLYHFTCDHSAPLIVADGGLIVPRVHPFLGFGVVWLTIERNPTAASLGFTGRTLVTCDRTAHRFAIDDPEDAVPWSQVRGRLPSNVARVFESARGTRPGGWYVSRVPQRGRLDDDLNL